MVGYFTGSGIAEVAMSTDLAMLVKLLTPLVITICHHLIKPTSSICPPTGERSGGLRSVAPLSLKNLRS